MSFRLHVFKKTIFTFDKYRRYKTQSDINIMTQWVKLLFKPRPPAASVCSSMVGCRRQPRMITTKSLTEFCIFIFTDCCDFSVRYLSVVGLITRCERCCLQGFSSTRIIFKYTSRSKTNYCSCSHRSCSGFIWCPASKQLDFLHVGNSI